MKRWMITLERRTINRLNHDTTRNKLKKIAKAAERNQELGFTAQVGKLAEPTTSYDETLKCDVYVYRVNIRITKKRVLNQDTVEEKFQHILRQVTLCAKTHEFTVLQGGNKQGSIPSGDGAGTGETVIDSISTCSSKPVFQLPELTREAIDEHFAGIYEREDQIRELYGAIKTHIDTQGELANHCLLYGQPGSCKTLLTERFKKWFDSKGSPEAYEWVKFIDGTTVTKAGAENWFKQLAEGDDVPIMLVLDEIEKQDKGWLLGLLSIMGSGIITKMNAYTGNFRARFTPFITGICNDEETLREFKNGALWSRFTHELHCPRPTRELAHMILHDLTTKIPNGKPLWADAAMEFGWDKLGQRDVRKLKGHLDGRDRLLDGSWQAACSRMLSIEKLEKDNITKEKARLGIL